MESPLTAGCTRCAAPVVRIDQDTWSCPEHGEIVPLWRPAMSSYDVFAVHLERVGAFPTYMPWPLGPGWSVSDFAAVATPSRARATMTCVSGSSALDGPVDVIVVSEEPGTGLGARIAGVAEDSDSQVGDGTSLVKIRLEARPVGLWSVSTSSADGDLDRSVLVGEAEGRWLWLVLRPASAILLLRDEWILRDVSATGPQLVTLPFGGPTPSW